MPRTDQRIELPERRGYIFTCDKHGPRNTNPKTAHLKTFSLRSIGYAMFMQHTDMPRKVENAMKPLLVVLGAVVVSPFFLVDCGGDASQASQGDSAKVELESAEDSGVSGTATFLTTTGGVEVKLDVRDLPKPDTIYLAHIHSGSCSEEAHEHREEQGAAHEHGGGEIEYPLSPVKSDSEGHASSTTMLWDTTMERLFSGEPKYVNVHASGQGIPPALACANLRDAN